MEEAVHLYLTFAEAVHPSLTLEETVHPNPEIDASHLMVPSGPVGGVISTYALQPPELHVMDRRYNSWLRKWAMNFLEHAAENSVFPHNNEQYFDA